MNPVERLMQYSTGHWISQMVYTFAKHAIADAFVDDWAKSEQLAKRCELNLDATYRLLRAVATLGLVEQDSDDEQLFYLTEMGCLLKQDHQQSLNDRVLLEASPDHVMLWTHLSDFLIAPQSAPKALFGVDCYLELFNDQAPGNCVFSRAMNGYSDDENAMILAMDSLDLSHVETMVDVGGGKGELLRALINQYPAMDGILFDQSAVVEKVESCIGMSVIGGDFFTSVPEDCDGYFLKRILSDWDDELCIRLLMNIAQVMVPNGRIYIAELGPIPSANEPHLSKFFDLQRMLMLNGAERTLAQWRDLLHQSGLQLVKVHQSFGALSVLEVSS